MSLPHIDLLSFWLGFGIAALIAFGLYWFRRQLGIGRDALAHRFKNVRELFTSGTERNFRKDTLRVAQTSHLAGALFALDDISLPPRLLIPDPDPDPTLPPPEEDLTLVIPKMAEWPELAAIYRAPTLSAAEAFSGRDHMLVLGSPGSGKSALLAHLASRAAQEDETGLFHGATPIFIHAGDIDVTQAAQGDVAQPLISAAQARAARVIGPQLPRHLRMRLREFKCVIFIDGFDELPPARIAESAGWLEQFLKAHRQHRVIAAADAWGHGPLLALGLAPIWLAPWNADDYHALIQQWGAAWQKNPARKKKSALADVDASILLGWLDGGNQGRSIFEVTLKLWGALAGDTRGNRPVDWLETFVARAGLTPLGLKALGKLAAHLLNYENGGLPRSELTALLDPVLATPDGKAQIDSDDYLDNLLSKRMLVRRAGDRLSFRHGLAGAYCAALGLLADPAGITPGLNPAWTRALNYFAPLGDLTPHVGKRLMQAPDLLQTDLLTCARWLRDAPAAAKWRGEIYRRLSQLLMNAQLPESLRLRALAAFVAAHDATIAALFKQALTSAEPFLRRMATLGLGTFIDAALVPPLSALLADGYLDVRWAATLALAANGSEKAIDTLVQGLTLGDDDLRRACAQALARNTENGHTLLKDAIQHKDLGTRRAAVYGLADTQADWALALLEDAHSNENEWFARSAMTEILERRKKGPLEALPRPYLPPESQGWLVAWAAQQGTGVPPGKAAVEVLNRALDHGDARTKHAAAEAIGRLADPASARQLYGAMRDPDMLLRDVAFRALAHVSTATAQRLAAPA
jgi:HEAT repeat protein